MAALFTPLTKENRINFDAIPSMKKRLMDWGVTKVMVAGTTGESVSLSVAERKKLLEAWMKAAEGTDLKV